MFVRMSTAVLLVASTAGCGYENVLTLGAGVVTFADVADTVPSPAGSVGLDVEWLHLFGVSSYLAGGEPLFMARLAPEFGLLSRTSRRHAPGPDDIPPWSFASSWTVTPIAGCWRWAAGPGGSCAMAGLRAAVCVEPHGQSDMKESFVVEYAFLWLFEASPGETAHVQVLRVGCVCGF